MKTKKTKNNIFIFFHLIALIIIFDIKALFKKLYLVIIFIGIIFNIPLICHILRLNFYKKGIHTLKNTTNKVI